MTYKSYPLNTSVRIISTGEEGEAYESYYEDIAVFIDGEKTCRYFDLNDVEFIK